MTKVRVTIGARIRYRPGGRPRVATESDLVFWLGLGLGLLLTSGQREPQG